MTPAFQLAGESGLYVSPGNAALCYFARDLPKGTVLPLSLDMTAALDGLPRGVFLLLDAPLSGSPTERAEFAKGVATLLSGNQHARTRVIWLAKGPPVRAQVYLNIEGMPGAWRIEASGAKLRLYNFSLLMSANGAVTANATGLVFAAGSAGGYCLSFDDTHGAGQAVFDLAGPVLLPFLTGSAADGALGLGSFDVAAPEATILNPSIRYFVPHPQEWAGVRTIVEPILDLARTQVSAGVAIFSLSGQLDLWAFDNAARSFFDIAAQGTLPATFVSAVGAPLDVTFIAGASRLVPTENVFHKPDHTGPVSRMFYLAPTGRFEIALAGMGAVEEGRSFAATPNLGATLMPGSSATEFLAPAGLGAQAGSVTLEIVFEPGHPAYSPILNSEQVLVRSPPRYGALTPHGSTSWARFSTAGAGVTYHAQPAESAQFALGAFNAGAGPADLLGLDADLGNPPAPAFLDFSAPASGMLAGGEALPVSLLLSVGHADAEISVAIDRQVLSPRRREIVPALTAPKGSGAATPSWTVTPTGLLLRENAGVWEELQVAHTRLPGGALQAVSLYNVRGALRAALQSGQLFLVISDAARFLGDCDLKYAFTSAVQFDLLELQDGLDPQVVAAIRAGFGTSGTPYIGETALWTTLAAILTAARLSGSIEAAKRPVARRAVSFAIRAADWTFDLSPYEWDERGALLVFKFLPQAMSGLAVNLDAWTMPQQFLQSVDAAQGVLRTAAEQAATDPDLAALSRIMTAPDWSGVLMLRPAAPLAGLPEQLAGLAAGIDAAQFGAHFVAAELTPVQPDPFAVDATTISALLAYQADARVIRAGPVGSYDYFVKLLTVVILETRVARFECGVAFYYQSLFGDRLAIPGPGYLQLDGYLQRSNSADVYVFLDSSVTRLQPDAGVMTGVQIDRVEFYTLRQEGASEGGMVHTRFMLNGVIAFRDWPTFDPLSFGVVSGTSGLRGLAVEGLAVDMRFRMALPQAKEFGANYSLARVSDAASTARDASLFSNFPMQINGLCAGSAQNRPDRAQYLPIDAPLDSTSLSDEWYGLTFDVDLGTPGALAAAMDFTARMIVAWSPSGGIPGSPHLFVGLALPGVEGGARSIKLQGVASLNFGGIDFVLGQVNAIGRRPHILRLNRITFGLLSLSLPTGGEIAMLLFGDPTAEGKQAVGWYASYQADAGLAPGKGAQQGGTLPGDALYPVGDLQRMMPRGRGSATGTRPVRARRTEPGGTRAT